MQLKIKILLSPLEKSFIEKATFDYQFITTSNSWILNILK